VSSGRLFNRPLVVANSVRPGLERQPTIPHTFISLFLKNALAVSILCVLPGVFAPAAAQPMSSQPAVYFDIPTQPLADALVAFGASTGLEVFYDGALAIGRHSTAVSGTLTPAEGLRHLLAGTGYVAVVTADPNTLTIVQAPSVARPAAVASNVQLRRYEPYFATLQSRIRDALCGSDGASNRQIIVSLWLESSGVISRSEVIGSGVDPARREAITRGVRGLEIGTSLPPGLPQPITMVIFPPTVDETAACPPQRRAVSN